MDLSHLWEEIYKEIDMKKYSDMQEELEIVHELFGFGGGKDVNFGKYVFGGFQGLEKDSPAEHELYLVLSKYFKGDVPEGLESTDVIKAIKLLLKKKKEYKELQPDGPIFRSGELKFKDQKHFIHIWKYFKGAKQFKGKTLDYLRSTKPYACKFQNSIQQFHTGKNITEYFNEISDSFMDRGAVTVIQEPKKIKKEFVVAEKLGLMLHDNKYTGSEFEVVRFSKSKLDCYIWLPYMEVFKSYVAWKCMDLWGNVNLSYDTITVRQDGIEITFDFGEAGLCKVDTPDDFNLMFSFALTGFKDFQKKVNNFFKDELPSKKERFADKWAGSTPEPEDEEDYDEYDDDE